jgi:hypothetical protein
MKPILISVYACLLTIPSFAQDADEAALRASVLRHVGQWEGTYTEIDATDGSVIQRFASLIESRLEGDNFIQNVTHRFSDGREETTEYLAQIENGTLVYPGGAPISMVRFTVSRLACQFLTGVSVMTRVHGIWNQLSSMPTARHA